ncbi:MAG: Sir2 family NAD-dependent protein deacetylase [Actinomycetales bacterium]
MPTPGIGLTGFARHDAAGTMKPLEKDQIALLDRAAELLSGHKFAVLTGAGLSTDSGIPDYRGPSAVPRSPLTYQEFVRDPALRQRYWARNQLGWRQLRHAAPNAGHYAVSRLERHGLTSGIITQNVDRLHEDAGAEDVVDLHGRFDQVACLRCSSVFSRDYIGARLDAANPGFVEDASRLGPIGQAPDADADLESAALIGAFRVVDCEVCAGMLKPDFVFFGENVPVYRVQRSFAMLDESRALLVAGSSLTVMSGLRFPRYMSRKGLPVVLLNRGATRGDPLATLKVDVGVSEALSYLASMLAAPGSPSAPIVR